MQVPEGSVAIYLLRLADEWPLSRLKVRNIGTFATLFVSIGAEDL